MDLIDRQAAIDAVRSYMADNDIEDSDWHADGIAYEIKRLPTAEPKTGRWVRDECGELYCSECGRYTEDRHDMMSEFEGMKCIALVPPNYCGYCGAKMKEVSDG